jgi:hypothetical protein
MKPWALTFSALGIALMLSACATTLFNADFESDMVYRRPSSSPAGPPTGDMIRIWNADPGNLVVIADGINGKSLIHSYQPSVSQVDFIGIENGRDTREFWAVWNGRAERFGPATPRLFFRVGNFNIGIANLEIVNGEFRASGERLGAVVLDEVHTVVMHVDDEAGTYSVSIFQRGGSSLSSGVEPLSHRRVVPGDRVFDISMSYDTTAASHTPSYTIDDILITEKEPQMP